MNLGALYMTGRGVRPDYVEAYMWFILATTGGSQTGAKALVHLHRVMTPEQLREAQQRAFSWQARLGVSEGDAARSHEQFLVNRAAIQL